MFKLISKIPYWQLIAIPLLMTFMGVASNQVVLIANHDRFPVMANEERIHKSCQPADAQDSFAAAIAKALGAPAAEAEAANPDPYACSNGGEFLDDVHVIMTPRTHLNLLADVFDMHDAIYSIGDFLLMFGDWLWSWAIIAWLVLVIRKFVE